MALCIYWPSPVDNFTRALRGEQRRTDSGFASWQKYRPENGHQENDPKLHLWQPLVGYNCIYADLWTGKWTCKIGGSVEELDQFLEFQTESKMAVEGVQCVNWTSNNGRQDTGTWPTSLPLLLLHLLRKKWNEFREERRQTYGGLYACAVVLCLTLE